MALSVSPLPAVVPSASVRLMVMSALDVEPSVEVASTVIVCDGAVSKSSWLASAIVTTPVLLSIVKRPSASSLNV